jgi:hypothetical protein
MANKKEWRAKGRKVVKRGKTIRYSLNYDKIYAARDEGKNEKKNN